MLHRSENKYVGVTQITEQIAGVSLPVVIGFLLALTAMRGALYATRVAVLRSVGDLLESVVIAVALVFLLLRPFLIQSFFIPSGSMHPTLWEGDHILVNKWTYRTRPIARGDVIVFRAPKVAAPDEKEFIKRVVGLPGDTIEVREGFVVVDETSIWTRNEIRACLGENLSVDQIDTMADLPPLRLTTDAIYLGCVRYSPQEFAKRCGKAGKKVEIHPGRVLRNGRMLIEYYVAEDPHYVMPAQTVPPDQLFVMGDNRNNSDDSHRWGMLDQDRVIGRADVVFWPFAHAGRIDP